MPRPLSKDLRKRIIAGKEEGKSHAEIAGQMQVCVSTVTRLLRLYRETGRYEVKASRAGRKPRLDEECLQRIAKRIGEQPDITLKELIEAFSLPVGVPALCRTLNQKLGLRRKEDGTRSGTTPSGDRGTTNGMAGKAKTP
jgi:transposase